MRVVSTFARSLGGWLSVIAIIGGTLLAYLLIGTLVFGTDKLRLDSQCENTGMFGTFEEALLGRRFWRIQRDLLNQQIAYWESIPNQQARLQEVERQATEQTDKTLNELYRTNPKLRPNLSEKQKETQALREKADSIEHEEFRAMTERTRLKTLRELRNCQRIAFSKAE